MDKFRTNEFLSAHGFCVPRRFLALKTEPLNETLDAVEKTLGFPIVAKPTDEGCSSAVMKLHDRAQLENYLKAAFRETEELDDEMRKSLGLAAGAPFPVKDSALIEEFVGARPGLLVKETTVGFHTVTSEHGVEYRVFWPSETPALGDVLSLEEKFLAGEGQNITPASYGLALAGKSVAQTDEIINNRV
ncbi:MAG: hypothetical protein NZ534_04810, partial [Bacteroidia bacterium]|nr:hypothetical protein [Bacteroidia bacterium]